MFAAYLHYSWRSKLGKEWFWNSACCVTSPIQSSYDGKSPSLSIGEERDLRWWEWAAISISTISLVKCEQIVRGSLLHNLILVTIPWIWNKQCGKNKHFLGALQQQCVIRVLYSWSFFSAPHLLSEADRGCFFSPPNPLWHTITNPLNPCHESYLPPFKGFLREDTVLPGHQRVDGLIEALSKPGVVLQLRHALSTGAHPFGEEVVRQAKGVLEEVERGVPESVTEQERCKCDDTKQQSKSPDFPSLG